MAYFPCHCHFRHLPIISLASSTPPSLGLAAEGAMVAESPQRTATSLGLLPILLAVSRGANEEEALRSCGFRDDVSAGDEGPSDPRGDVTAVPIKAKVGLDWIR